MSLTLLRHAAIPNIYQRRYIGWCDIEIEEAFFDPDKFRQKNFDLIFSSDLKRCTQTLDLLGFAYTTERRLREVRFKEEIEGKSFEEVEKLPSFSPNYLKDIHHWHHYIAQESEEAFSSRIVSFLKSLPRDKKILICTHAGVINVILKHYHIDKQPLSYLDSITLHDY